MTQMRPPAQQGLCDPHGVSSGNTASGPGGSTAGGDGGCVSDPECDPACNRADGGARISLFNGQEVRGEVDLFIPGRDPDVDFAIRRRHFSRLPQTSSIFGGAWAFNYAHGFIEQDDGSLLVVGFGRMDRFNEVAPNTWEGALGRYGRLTFDGASESVLWMPGGTSLIYNTEVLPDGRLMAHLVELVSSYGNRITLEYESASVVPNLWERRLLRMTESFGRDITFHYEDSDYALGVSRIREEFSGREVLYDYNSEGQLLSVRKPIVVSTGGLNNFPLGKTTTYTYADSVIDTDAIAQSFFQLSAAQIDQLTSGPDLNENVLQGVLRIKAAFRNALSSVVHPNQAGSGNTRLEWTYYTDFSSFDFAYVQTHTVGNTALGVGGTFSYAYEMVTEGSGGSNEVAFRTEVTDRRGTLTRYEFNVTGQMLSESVETQGLRPNQPSEYTRAFTYNDDGDLLSSVNPMGGMTLFGMSDSQSVPRRSRGNRTATMRLPDAARAASTDQPFISRSVVYEPVFNRVFKRIEPRGVESGNQEAFTTTYVLDYMEDLAGARAQFAAQMGISEAELQSLFDAAGIISTGDVNGDGITSQRAGHVVQAIHPTVALPAQAARLALNPTQASVQTWTYNLFGQKIRHVDPEGNVTTWEYYPETDPDGDGVTDNPGGNPQTGGYLKSVVRDAEANPARNSGQNPPVILQTVEYEYKAQGAFPKNPRGQPTAIIDPRGIKHTRLVNELDQVVKRVRAKDVSGSPEIGLSEFAYEKIWIYDANDNVVEIREQNKAGLSGANDFIVHRFDYDILDQLTAETWDVGNIGIRNGFMYDPSQNRTVSIWGAGSSEVSIDAESYDERDIVVSSVRGLFAPEQSATTTEIDLNGDRTAWIDADGDRMEVARDGYDRVKQVTDRVGDRQVYSYDSASNLTSLLSYGPPAPGAGEALLAARYHLYDNRERLVRKDRALFRTPSVPGLTASDQGDLAINSPSASECFSNFLCVSAVYLYDRSSRVVGVVGGDDDLYERRYDGLSRLISEIDPLGNEVDLQYDPTDNLTRTTETEKSNLLATPELFVTLLKRDSLGRIQMINEPNGQQAHLSYDSRDNLIRRTDALFNLTEWEPDRLDRIISERRYLAPLIPGQTAIEGTPTTADPSQGGGDGRIEIQREFDDLHRIIARTDDNGSRTEYDYDDLSRVTEIRYADGTKESWTYNGDDEPLTHTTPNFSVETWTHDAESRPTQVLIDNSFAGPPAAVGSLVRRWEYDGLDRVVSTFDDNGLGPDVNVRVFYDSLSRRVRETQTVAGFPGLNTDERWRADAQRFLTVYPNGRQVRSLHDDLDREFRIEEATGQTISTYDYVGARRDLRITLGNGSFLDLRNDADTQSITGPGAGYDTNRRNVRRRWLKSGGQLIAGYATEYNLVNVMVEERREHLGRGDRFGLDSAYRLTDFRHNAPLQGDALAPPAGGMEQLARTSVWELDGAHNWSTYIRRLENLTPTVDLAGGVNEYSTFGGATQSFDNDGNLLEEQSKSYRYDVSDRLVDVLAPGGSSVAKYIYDAENRRVLKITPTGTTRYLYRGWEVIEERSGSGDPTQQYVYRWGIDDPVQLKKLAGSGPGTYYYHADSRRNVGAVTDLGQSVIYHTEYDAWGDGSLGGTALVSPVDPGLFLSVDPIGNPLLWQGRRLDSETDLYYYRHRYYNAEQGRFVHGDPLGAWHDMENVGNRYGFVGGRPGFLDPFGLATFDDSVPQEFRDRIDSMLDRVDPKRVSESLNRNVAKEALGRNKGISTTPGELREILTPGQGPRIRVGEVDGGLGSGSFDVVDGVEEITLDPDYLDNLLKEEGDRACVVPSFCEPKPGTCCAELCRAPEPTEETLRDLDSAVVHEALHGVARRRIGTRALADDMTGISDNQERIIQETTKETFGRRTPKFRPRSR